MAEIACLSPGCTFTAKDDDPEKAKRVVVAHTNETHAEAHVLIACAHDWQEIERFMAKTRAGDTGAPVEFAQVRSQCSRCGQFEVRDDDSIVQVDFDETADGVTVSDG